jgi:hypothetical protein
MEFALWYLLIPYGLIVALAGAFFFFNLFHIARYGLQSVKTGIVLLIYTITFLAVCIISVFLLGAYDWSAVIELNGLFSLSL